MLLWAGGLLSAAEVLQLLLLSGVESGGAQTVVPVESLQRLATNCQTAMLQRGERCSNCLWSLSEGCRREGCSCSCSNCHP